MIPKKKLFIVKRILLVGTLGMPIGVRVLRVKRIVIETLEILGWTTGG